MEADKKPTDGAGGSAFTGKRGRDHGGPPPDEEVDEFFATLRRIHVALAYFRKRSRAGGCDQTAPETSPWKPSFQPEDFHAGAGEKTGGSRVPGLDLNSDPGTGQ